MELEVRAEGGLVARREFLAREAVVLAALLLDLDGAEQRSDAPRRLPVEAMHQPVQETRAVGVAAAGGVHHPRRLRARNVDLSVARVDPGTLRAAGDH